VQMLEKLLLVEGVDWSKVTCFHLDEYVGITDQHPASFKKYLKERFADRIDGGLAAFHYVVGSGDAQEECTRLNALIAQYVRAGHARLHVRAALARRRAQRAPQSNACRVPGRRGVEFGE